jgi:hypothetical protein
MSKKSAMLSQMANVWLSLANFVGDKIRWNNERTQILI